MRRISSARDNAEVTTAGMPDFLSARHDLSGEGPVDWSTGNPGYRYSPNNPDTMFGRGEDPTGAVEYDQNGQPTRGFAWPEGHPDIDEVSTDLPGGLEPDEAHAEVEKLFPEGSGGDPAYRGRHRASFSDHIDDDGNIDWDSVHDDKDDSEEEE